MRRCPVCGNRNDGEGTEPGCNPHNCPSWEVTHVYDRKSQEWVPRRTDTPCDTCRGGGYVPADEVTTHLRRPRIPCPSCSVGRSAS